MHGKAGNVTTEQAAYDGSPEVKASFHHPTGSQVALDATVAPSFGMPPVGDHHKDTAWHMACLSLACYTSSSITAITALTHHILASD